MSNLVKLVVVLWLFVCGLFVRLFGTGKPSQEVRIITKNSVANRKPLKQCVTGQEITAGGGTVNNSKVGRPVWVPHLCSYEAFSKDDIRQCLQNITIVGIGDSIGGVLVQSISLHADLELKENPSWNHSQFLPAAYTSVHGNKYSASYGLRDTNAISLSFIWSPTHSREWERGEFRERNITTWAYEGTRQLVKGADVVFLSIAIWEMALFYSKPNIFVDVWRSRLRELKTTMRPTARIIILGLHWLDLKIDDPQSFSGRCFSGDKASVFRNALEVLASCEGVEIIGLHHVTRHPPERYIDAVHMPHSVNVMISDLLFSAACDGVPFTPPDYSCTSTNVTQTYLRWASVSEAQYGCRKPLSPPMIILIVIVAVASAAVVGRRLFSHLFWCCDGLES